MSSSLSLQFGNSCSAHRNRPSLDWRWPGCSPLGFCCAFLVSLAISLVTLYWRHPHEDAYILFKYAENLADGNGIVYFRGGPHAEGATDFLWFLLISGLRRMGLDVALSAALLNAFGAAFIVASLIRLVSRMSAGYAYRALLGLASFSVLLTSPALAGHEGFSAMAYSAVTVLLFALTVSASGLTLLFIPPVALVLALIRPDGVIPAVLFTLVGLWRAWRDGLFWSYFWMCAGVCFGGIAYFAWRWLYFGLALPLPLYVKKHVGGLPGLIPNLKWLRHMLGPKWALGVIAILFGWSVVRGIRGAGWLLMCMLPLLGLFIVLVFGAHLQNIAFRFQAPILVTVLFAMFWMATAAVGCIDRPLGKLCVVLPVACVAFLMGFTGSKVMYDRLRNCRTYLDCFPALVSRHLDERCVIVLTEAGSLGYWLPSPVYDLIGLNNPYTARRPPGVDYLESIKPDIVMFHHAGTLDEKIARMKSHYGIASLDAIDLHEMVKPSVRETFERGYERQAETWDPVQVAAVVAAAYLHRSAEYEIYAIMYRGEYSHIYGIRRELPDREDIIADLRRTVGLREYYSYADLKHFPFARNPYAGNQFSLGMSRGNAQPRQVWSPRTVAERDPTRLDFYEGL